MGPPNGVNGVLPVAVLQKNTPQPAPRGPKAASPRLKLVLRRLPPGLTKSEFDSILGDEWKPGAGKVDWLSYKKGKVTRDAAKPSKPSRAYFHVTAQTHVLTLGEHVRQVSFNDAAKSFQDPALVGPPVLEYAPYHRIPGGRKRNDARQGLIDQDQEFKDFLESLTNPVTKPVVAESAEGHKEEKVKTTPLIEALREKKANKDKPSKASGKHGRGESKEDQADKKILAKAGKETSSSSGDKNRRLNKAEKAAKDAVKVLNKEASSSKESASAAAEKSTPTTPSPAPERKRGNASIAKSMLQRDLGLGPGPNRRRGTKREVTPATQESTTKPEETAAGKQKAKEAPPPAGTVTPASAEKSAPTSAKKESSRPTRAERRAYKASLADKTNSSKTPEDPKAQTKAAAAPAPVILKKPQSTPTPTAPKGPAASRAAPTEPAASRNQASQVQATSARNETTSSPRPSAPAISQPATSPSTTTPTARQGFLKHANASQGITEPLIEEALKVFGAVEKVEIDTRKGFAYVDFAEPEGLQKAIAASPIKVAQGAVQVLERKEKVVRRPPHPGPPAHHGPPTGPARGGRGGFPQRGRGRGGARGGAHASAAPSAGVGDGAPPPPTATSTTAGSAPPAATDAAT